MGRKKISPKESMKTVALIAAGSILLALAINIFIDPNKIAPGGLSGVAIALKALFGWHLGITMLILNIPVFIIGVMTVGAKFGWRSILGTIILSGAVDFTAPFVTPLTHNLLLASVFGGAFAGIGLALVFMAGATTGGTDLIAQIVHKYVHGISVGKLLMICDGIVVIFATIAFKYKNPHLQVYELAMYDIITIFITSTLIDTILEGVDYAKGIFVISDKSELIAERLMTELDRGVTGLEARGMFRKVEKTVLLCVVKRTEVNEVKIISKEVDPNAFVILTDVREVLGEGFKEI